MKLQRTGIAEAILLFDDWLGKNNYPKLPHVEGEFINWLYTTSGWHDSTIKGTYFDIDIEAVKKSEVYQKWKKDFHDALLGCDYLEVMLWNTWIDAYFPNMYPQFREFVKSFGAKDDSLNEASPYYNYWKNPEKMFPLLKGKVLIINPMSPLFVKQYKNARKIYPDMPEFEPIAQLFPYCFFNSHLDGNSFNTIDRIFNEVMEKDFDIALVSIGSHGAILADRLNKAGKTTLTVGSGLPLLFGVQPKRKEKYWVSKIPDEYIPEGYMKIENGRYWIGGE